MNHYRVSTSPEMQASLRIGDADREAVVQALQRHTGEGRLSLDSMMSAMAAGMPGCG